MSDRPQLMTEANRVTFFGALLMIKNSPVIASCALQPAMMHSLLDHFIRGTSHDQGQVLHHNLTVGAEIFFCS